MRPATKRAVQVGGYALGAAGLAGLLYFMVMLWFFWLAGPFDLSFMDAGRDAPRRRTTDLLAALAATLVTAVAVFCAVRVHRLRRQR